MDFVQSLDPSKLVLAGTGVSFFLTLFTSPSYNLPIFLFGCYVQENTEAAQSLQTFTGLLGASIFFDFVWLFSHEQHGFAKLVNILLLLLKLPTLLAFMNVLRQRRGQFPGLGTTNLTGPTVWSMPGGFTLNGSGGYQTVDEDSFIRNVRPAAPSGPSHHKPPPITEQPAAPGAYQTV